MIRQLTKGIRRRRLFHAAVRLVIAAVMLAVLAPDLSRLVRGPADLYTLDPAGLEGQYVSARVDIIYGWYAETVRASGTDREQTVRREYIIPVGSAEYMGMEVHSQQFAAAQAVLDTTDAVLHGTAESLDGSQVIVTGTVRRMDSQTRQYFQQAAGLAGYSARERSRFLPLVLVEGQVGSLTLPELGLGLAAFGFFALSGLLYLVQGIRCQGPEQPVAYLQEAAGDSAPLLRDELESFYRQTRPLGRLRANCRWLLCEDGADSWLLYNRDVAWVYAEPAGRQYQVVVCARSPAGRRLRRRYRIRARNAAEAEQLLDLLRPLLPEAVFGYDPRWEPLYQASPARFCRDIKARQQAEHTAAARRGARNGWPESSQ